MDLTIAADGLCAALMPLDYAFVNSRSRVFEIHIAAPECYCFARAGTLPELEKDESVVVRALEPEGFEDSFALLWRVRIDARLSVGDRKRLEKCTVKEIGFHQTINAGVPEHGAEATVNDAVHASGLESLRFEL